MVAHSRQVGRDALPGGGEDQTVHSQQLHQVQEGVGEHRVEAGHEAEPAELRVEGDELQVGPIKDFRLCEEEIFLVVQSNYLALSKQTDISNYGCYLLNLLKTMSVL